MPRGPQLLFALAVLTFSWLAMQAVHECGHLLGAVLTGGTVERVVLHPLTISRTDVAPNPRPAVVVWMGPLAGVLLPLVIAGFIPRRWQLVRGTALFFAGFCLVANGVYLGAGTMAGIGDAREMLRTGSPRWSAAAFGAVASTAGLLIWHWLGSPRAWMTRREALSWQAAAGMWLATAVLIAVLTVIDGGP